MAHSLSPTALLRSAQHIVSSTSARSPACLLPTFPALSASQSRCFHHAPHPDAQIFSHEQQKLSSYPLSHRPTSTSSVAALAGPLRNTLFQPTTQNRQPNSESNDDQNGISENEYRLRVGKACRILVDTLPDFMHRGVADLEDLHPSPSSSSYDKSESRPSPFLGQSIFRHSPWKGKAKAKDPSTSLESIYHPSIAFRFRPPIPHIGLSSTGNDQETRKSLARPSSAGSSSSSDQDSHHSYAPTISFQGRTLYVASSHVLRHALSALFYDTMLAIETARFEGRSRPGTCWPGISSHIRSTDQADSASGGPDRLTIRLRFEGMTRMSSAHHTYTVLFCYEFDRETGTIVKHIVNKIQPVPGSKVWVGLTTAWGHLSPAGGQGGAGAGGGMTPTRVVKCPSIESKEK